MPDPPAWIDVVVVDAVIRAGPPGAAAAGALDRHVAVAGADVRGILGGGLELNSIIVRGPHAACAGDADRPAPPAVDRGGRQVDPVVRAGPPDVAAAGALDRHVAVAGADGRVVGLGAGLE